MKFNLLLLSLAISVLISCTSGDEHATATYGKQFDTTGSTTLDAAILKLASGSSLDCKVVGKVKSVCQGEGCWLTLEKGDSGSFMVRIKDQSFHFPKDIAGKQVLISGNLHRDTVEVDASEQSVGGDLKTSAVKDSLQLPEVEVSMDATGLIVR